MSSITSQYMICIFYYSVIQTNYRYIDFNPLWAAIYWAAMHGDNPVAMHRPVEVYFALVEARLNYIWNRAPIGISSTCSINRK